MSQYSIVLARPNVITVSYGGRQPDLRQDVVTAYRSGERTDFVSRRRPLPAELFSRGTSYKHHDSHCFSVSPAVNIVNTGWGPEWHYDHGYVPAYDPRVAGTIYTTSGPIPDYVIGPLRTKALLAIKQQKVNLSVTIVELPKTANMVRDLALDTYRFLRSLRKGDAKSLVRAVKGSPDSIDKAAAKRWLQYQYGIIPSVLEVNGLADLIRNKIRAGIWVYGSVTDRSFGSRSYTTGTSSWVAHRDTRLKCSYRYLIRRSDLASLAQSGITNPLALGYELIPYSFVVDWFFNISDYLATLDALVGIPDIEAIYSGTEYEVRDVTKRPTWTNPGRAVVIMRTSRRDAPVTGIKPYRPVYKPHVSITRMVSAVALLRNFFR